MIAFEHPYAGMILPDASDLDPAAYLDAATAALTRHDRGAPPQRHAETGRVTGGRFSISVTPEEDSDYGPRMVFAISAADGGRTEDEHAARLLSDCVLLALKTSQADIVEWYSPDVLIDREDFIRLRSYVSPRRTRPQPRRIKAEAPRRPRPPAAASASRDPRSLPAQTAPAPLTKAPQAAKAEPAPRPEAPPAAAAQPEVSPRHGKTLVKLAPQEPEARRIECAGWLMTGAVGVFSVPVAVFLSIVGLFRGMDFRLVSQAAAVTALFVVLYNTDRLQGVVHQFLR
jgi:hypothetical protein